MLDRHADVTPTLLQHTLKELADARDLLRSKDEDLRSKDEDLRTMLQSKDEDLRSKDEDLRQLNAELKQALPLAAQLQLERMKQFRAENIVDCRGALEYVAGLLHLHHVGHQAGWSEYFASAGYQIVHGCNSIPKIVADNNHRQHTSESLAVKVKHIWSRLSSDLHRSHKFSAVGASIVLRSNGLSTSDVLLLHQLFEAHGIKTEIQNVD